MNFHRFQWRSLKTRLTVFTLVIFLSSLWSLAFYASHLLRQDVQTLLGDQQFSTASFVAAEVNEGLQSRSANLEMVADAIDSDMLGNPADLQRFLELRLVLLSQFNGGVMAYRLDGVAIADVPRSAARIGVNYMDLDCVAAALKDGRSTIGRPTMGRTLLAPIFPMAVPIRDKQGRVIGALAGATNLAKPNFLDKLTQGQYGKTGGYVLAAPQHGLNVTASNPGRIMAVLPAPGINPTMDRYARGHEGTDVFINPLGVEVLASAKGVPVAGWYVAVTMPTEEAFAPIDAMQRRMLLATIFLTLLAGGLTSWMLRRQLAPMLAAAETLATLSAAEQPIAPLPITRPDEIGQLIGGFNRLIESLTQRREALKASEARFRCLTEMSSDFYWETDVEHRLTRRTESNNGSADLDLRLAQIIGLRRWEITSLSPDQVGWRAHRALLDAHLPFREFEISRIGGNDVVRHTSVSGDPVFDAGGNFTGYRGIGADITVRKRAEALLKAQQTQIKLAAQVFAQGREGITISDAQGNIIMANQAFTEISGYTEAELLGKNMRIMSSGQHSPDFYRAMWQAITTHDYWAGEIWDRRKDGTDYPAWLSISTMRDAKGQITNYLGNFSDLSDAKAAEMLIQRLSYFDTLTGLPNRALLRDRTAHTINMVERSSEPMIIMLVAIDHFKRITDSVGHSIGDELLLEMAKRISDSVRPQDTVARLDGKEFVLLLPGTGVNGAAHVAQELLLKLAQPCQLGHQKLTVTASIGIASYPENGSDFDTLLKAVDIAVHRAQVNGRDAFAFYTDDMYQQVWARDHLIHALRNALELDQLGLVYQPLLDLQTGQISGMEALLRWHLPELGAVSPAQFIPLAEEAGLIKGIGEWVLRRACRDIHHWLGQGIKVPPVAVNVSPLQFHDNDLIAQVQGALAEWQLDPALICIEVTEGALMNDVPQSGAMLKELKDLGVKLSLDDFGTGYSSLSYLKRFPFDKVKIDQSFVRDVTSNHSDVVLVNVIVAMAHGLGMTVVAEGVETEAQCEIMRTSVCDEIQGYFFSKPISAQAIEALLSEGRQLPRHLTRRLQNETGQSELLATPG